MIVYRDIPFNEIAVIKYLWEKNKKYHEDISEFFGDDYASLNFDDRINAFCTYEKDNLKITIAEDSISDITLGYCISTFQGIEGQTHSLHVSEESRGLGIGKELMQRHLEWLRSSGCKDISITVAYENTNTIDFYKSLGFKLNTIEMKLK